ncbi:MAG: cytochrome c [Chromatiaceae bacterium]|jgi:cytochrome c556|nr:cytochrome c [Chromatiaceae bacterium]
MNKTTLIAAALITAASAVQAQEPEDYIKYRQAMMAAIGGHNSAASQIVRGKVSPEGALAMHARALAELTSDLPSLFPEGSDFGETKAKAEIWSDRAGFEKAASDAKSATAAFAEVVAGGDAAKIAAAFKDVGEACKGCHKTYREKDD